MSCRRMQGTTLALCFVAAWQVAVHAEVTTYMNDLAGFNAAAHNPPIVVDFDSFPPNFDISGLTVLGVTFLGPDAPLLVVRGDDTYTPVGFSPPGNENDRLFPTTPNNCLSPGGVVLGPGPDPVIEGDSLQLLFNPPVRAVGLDILEQRADGSGYPIRVYDQDNNLIYTNTLVTPFISDSSGGTDFCGVVSDGALISRIELDELDNNNVFPDSNVGYDTIRIGTDCNSNGVPDEFEIADGTSADCNTNGVPDECDLDFDADGTIDDCDGDIDNDTIVNDLDVCDYTPPSAVVDGEGRPFGDIDEDCDVDLQDYSLFQTGITGSIVGRSCRDPAGQACLVDFEREQGFELIEHGPGQCENTGCEPGPSLEFFDVSIPVTATPGQEVEFSIDWNRCDDCNPNAVIYTSLIGDWAPDSPLYVSNAYFTNCSDTSNDTVIFLAPMEHGEYRVRWIKCFAFDPIRQFCGESDQGTVNDPGACPYVEATFRVCE